MSRLSSHDPRGRVRRFARVLVWALRRFWEQNMFHHAAALTYHSLLAFFQALLLGVAMLGVLGTRATVQVNDVVIEGTHAVLGETKSALNFLVFDSSAGFRNVRVTR